ncbi:MAG: hypothetical protein E7064_06625 [Spirochaetaceae bacterium]|nr:hypothetical protein [Spirochaetaceae bacterium]
MQSSDCENIETLIPHFVIVEKEEIIDFKKTDNNCSIFWFEGKERHTKVKPDEISIFNNYFELLKSKFYWFRYKYDWMLTKKELQEKLEFERQMDIEMKKLYNF